MEYLNVRTMEKSKGLQPSDSMPQSARPLFTVQDQGYTMSQETVLGAPENVILQTKNYGMFKLDPLNRVIRQDKVDHLYDAIKEKNLLHLFPIVVSRDFVIIDGQHRHKAAEALDTWLYYIVSDQMRIEDAASATSNTNGWNIKDYFDHFCKRGFPHYLQLRDFWASRQWLTLSTAAALCYHGDTVGKGSSKSVYMKFSLGTWEANNVEGAERICTMLLGFSSWVPFWKENPFISAIRNLDSNADYDHARMMMKIQYQSSKLVKCASAEDYINVMNTIYNYKVPEDRKVQLRKINPTNSKWRK